MKTLAKDIMSSSLLVAQDKMTVEEALKLLVNNKVTGLPVVDKNGKMVGVLSEYDIIETVAKDKKMVSNTDLKKTIKYTKSVDAISEDMPLHEILNHFIETKYRRLPVIDKKARLVGIITRRDIMRLLYYRAKVS